MAVSVRDQGLCRRILSVHHRSSSSCNYPWNIASLLGTGKQFQQWNFEFIFYPIGTNSMLEFIVDNSNGQSQVLWPKT